MSSAPSDNNTCSSRQTTTTLVVVVGPAHSGINVFRVMIDNALWDKHFHFNVSVLSRTGTLRTQRRYSDYSFNAFATKYTDSAAILWPIISSEFLIKNAVKCAEPLTITFVLLIVLKSRYHSA